MVMPPMGPVCMIRRSGDDPMDGSCGRPPKRKAAEEAKKNIRTSARPNEVEGHPVNDVKKVKTSSEETQAMKDREAELRQHAGAEYKDAHAVLNTDETARKGMNLDKVVKNDKGEILGVVPNVLYHKTSRSTNFASDRGKEAKGRQDALHSELAREKKLPNGESMSKAQWLNHYRGESTVVDEGLPVALRITTLPRSSTAQESSQQGGAMSAHAKKIQPGDKVLFSYSGNAAPEHKQMYDELQAKGEAARQRQNAGGSSPEPMDLSRRDLSEAQIVKVTEVGRFVEQADNTEGDFVVSVNPIKEITKDVSGVSSEINMPAEDVETPSIVEQSGMVAEGAKQTEIDQSIETGADELAAKETTKEAIANTLE
ncbi:hypothetical protein HDU67_009849 [Dinochytrium kinnereticum]|nr:hypothetical protein HDU67_009849 [Dinochytrium kinnereticum]